MMRYKILQVLEQDEFVRRIAGIVSAVSPGKGAEYIDIRISGKYIYGIRKSSACLFKIRLDKLYEAHKNEESIDTNVLKGYTSHVQSPALAILKEIDVI